MEHTAGVTSEITISPNGKLLVSGDYDGTVRLCSIANTTFTVSRLDSSYSFAYHSEVNFEQNLFPEAISNAEKVIELNPLFMDMN